MEQQLAFAGLEPPARPPTIALGPILKPEQCEDLSVACDELRKDGWEYIGNGSYTTVMISPCGKRVVKFAYGGGQEATVEAARANPDNPHFPRIYDVWETEDGLVYESEALEPLMDEEWGSFDWADFDTYPAEYKAWARRWNPEGNWNRVKFGPNGPMKEALKALNDAIGSEDWVGWDVHPGNLMRRPSDGTLVLNDLLA